MTGVETSYVYFGLVGFGIGAGVRAVIRMLDA